MMDGIHDRKAYPGLLTFKSPKLYSAPQLVKVGKRQAEVALQMWTVLLRADNPQVVVIPADWRSVLANHLAVSFSAFDPPTSCQTATAALLQAELGPAPKCTCSCLTKPPIDTVRVDSSAASVAASRHKGAYE